MSKESSNYDLTIELQSKNYFFLAHLANSRFSPLLQKKPHMNPPYLNLCPLGQGLEEKNLSAPQPQDIWTLLPQVLTSSRYHNLLRSPPHFENA